MHNTCVHARDIYVHARDIYLNCACVHARDVTYMGVIWTKMSVIKSAVLLTSADNNVIITHNVVSIPTCRTISVI